MRRYLLPIPELEEILRRAGGRVAPREGSPSASTAKAGGTDTQIVLLLGRLLWDVFSDNHTVVDSDGIAYDLGTFRQSGAVIARVINRRYADAPARYGYLDFYLGTRLMEDRQALRPVYRWFFEELREAGCDWEYSFPRLYVHEVRPDRTEEDDPVTYDPSCAASSQTWRTTSPVSRTACDRRRFLRLDRVRHRRYIRFGLRGGARRELVRRLP